MFVDFVWLRWFGVCCFVGLWWVCLLFVVLICVVVCLSVVVCFGLVVVGGFLFVL